jgi:hypothetical protein
VRAWCAWCIKRDLPPLPGSGADVAAFLASERGRGLTPETLKLRRAAGCAVPTDDVAVSGTLSGIRRQAARQGETQRKKVAATAGEPIAAFRNSPLPCRLLERGVGPVLMDVITQSLVQHLLLALPQIEF